MLFVQVHLYYCTCVLVLLYICSHATLDVQLRMLFVQVHLYYCTCVLVLLYMCSHATVGVHANICVRMLL